MLTTHCRQAVSFSLLVAASAIFSCAADIVELADGSKIVGVARRLAEGKLVLATDFAGEIGIDWVQVRVLDTENPQLRNLKPRPAPEPAAAPPAAATERVWSYDVAFNLAGKSGNTDKTETGGSLGAALKGPDDTLRLHLSMERAKSEGEETDDRAKLGLDYERKIADRTSWYIRSEMLEDAFKDIDLRWTTAAGLGHYLVKKPEHELQARLGLSYIFEKYADPEPGSGKDDRGTEETVGLDIGLRQVLELGTWAKLATDLKWLPQFDDAKNYRAYHETSLDIPIAGSALWKLRLGIANEYESMPANDRKRLDTSYFVRIALAWEQGGFLKAAGIHND